MASTITVPTRSVAVAVGGVLAVVAGYVAGAGTSGAVANPAPDPSAPSTISVSGTGEVTAVPDQLTFRLTVTSKADDVTEALDRGNATMRRTLAALQAEGVKRRDTQSTGLGIRPEYDHSSEGPPVLTGYVADQSVSVTVRELARAGRVLSAAASAGGNDVRINGIALEVDDREALLRRARDGAVEAARDKAEQYATASGLALGRVVTISEGRADEPRPPVLASQELALADRAVSDVPVRAGREELRVTVAVVWELE